MTDNGRASHILSFQQRRTDFKQTLWQLKVMNKGKLKVIKHYKERCECTVEHQEHRLTGKILKDVFPLSLH